MQRRERIRLGPGTVAKELGHPVIDLQRIAIAGIKLNGLEEGNWRELSKVEWGFLLKSETSLLI